MSGSPAVFPGGRPFPRLETPFSPIPRASHRRPRGTALTRLVVRLAGVMVWRRRHEAQVARRLRRPPRSVEIVPERVASLGPDEEDQMQRGEEEIAGAQQDESGRL